ncbi:flavodoxin [Leuconostoc sp. MS02]|uniref:Flavodoxin n=1 Tax=Leuconostoc aquikimchii TaxID=3236804 RepID=A0ABV3S4B5_9LACO
MIIYYSLTGHTKKVALKIAEKTEDKLYEVQLDKPYQNNPLVVARFTKEKALGVIPAAHKITIDDHVIYLGYPMWGMDMSLAMQGFLTANDLSGKIIKPFITSGTSTLKMSLKTLKKLAPDTIIDANFDPDTL